MTIGEYCTKPVHRDCAIFIFLFLHGYTMGSLEFARGQLKNCTYNSSSSGSHSAFALGWFLAIGPFYAGAIHITLT